MPAPDHTIVPDPGDRAGRHRSAIVAFVVTAALLLAIDLVVKPVAFEHVAGVPVTIDETARESGLIVAHETRIVVPRILGLHLTLNRGAVFGLGQGGRWFFAAFSVIAAIVIVTVFWRSPRSARLFHLALASVLAGAIGNLYDRLVYGVVRDMLVLFPDVTLPFGWRWPDGSAALYPWIFNVADVCLVVGLALLLVLMYRSDRAERATERQAAAGRGDAADPAEPGET